MASQQKGAAYQILPTPSPIEVSFKILVDATQFRPEDLPYDNQPFVTCDGIKAKPKFLTDYYSNYVYTYATRDENGLWLFFAKSKTEKERDTPFKTFHSTRSYPWPSVLEDLYFVNNPSLSVKSRLRPSITVDSITKIEQFLSPIEWPKKVFRHPQPIPTDVRGNYQGINVDFPRCLHQEVVFPDNRLSKVIFGVGVVNAPNGRNARNVVIPATNFTDWGPFVISDRQEPTNGVWLREKVTIYPPSVQDLI